MAWLTTSEIRAKFSIQANKYESQIESAIEDAALVIQRGVGSDIYAEAIDDDPPVDAAELLRYKSVTQAHAYLTMWFLVKTVGSKLSEGGFVKAQQDSASPAMNSRVITNSYLTPKEMAEMKDDLLNTARFHLGDYGVITVVEIEPATQQQQLAVSSLQWF
jgi:superfamily II helicase